MDWLTHFEERTERRNTGSNAAMGRLACVTGNGLCRGPTLRVAHHRLFRVTPGNLVMYVAFVEEE
jgi:hypothetical protein